MSRMKKIMAVVLCVLLTLSLAACGGQGQNAGESEKTNEPAVTDSALGTETEAATETMETEAAGNVVQQNEPLVLVKQITNDNAYGEYLYDETGRVIMEVTYFKQKVSHRYVYTYTEQEDGTTLVRIMDEVPEDGTGYELFFDAEGKCVEKLDYWSGNTDPEKIFSSKFIRGQHSYEYDENGRLTTMTYVNEGGHGTIYTYGYDEAGRMISREERSVGDETLIQSETFTRDENGDVIRCERYSATFGESVGEYEWRYYYNDENNLVRKKEARPINQEIEYEYNDDGSLLRMTVDDQLGTLPELLYLKSGHLVNLCEYSEFVMMPLSQALAQQASGQ